MLDNDISNRLKEIFEYISSNYNITLEDWKHDKDHIHVFFKAHPISELSKFINAYKSASSRLIKKEFPSIKKFLWSRSYWITTGGATIDVVKKYIENQGKKR